MKLLFLLILCIIVIPGFGQESLKRTEEVFRVNILNPGIEYEYPVFDKSTISGGIGIGYGIPYPETSYLATGWHYLVSPYLDAQWKRFYTFKKREIKAKNINFNSANFFGARTLIRHTGISISNFYRTTNIDLAMSPIWGVQRAYGTFHLLFSIGPIVYTDFMGNWGFYPINIELNLGIDIVRNQKQRTKNECKQIR